MNIEPVASLEEVTALLLESALPVADISHRSPLRFFGVRAGAALMAVVGVELYPPYGLLRSLEVRSDHRRRGHARVLVAFAESWSAAQGVGSLFLLTTTADQFFLGLGYSPASRDEAPAAIQGTSQFSGLCPASSTLLCRRVTGNPGKKGARKDSEILLSAIDQVSQLPGRIGSAVRICYHLALPFFAFTSLASGK